MKKGFISILVAITLLLSVCSFASAAKPVSFMSDIEAQNYFDDFITQAKERESNTTDPRNAVYVTSDEFASLTRDDIEYLFGLIDSFSSRSRTLGIQLNELVISEIKDIVYDENHTSTRGVFNLNAMELLYCAGYPIHGIAYVQMSEMCQTKAYSIYTEGSCWYSGNGDAFRHVSWNVLLYRAFHGYNNVDGLAGFTLEQRVKLFTDAHEYYEPDGVDKTMDLQNNIKGLQYCAPAWFLNSINDIFTYVENYCDLGFAYRVGEKNGVRVLVATNNSEKN